MAIQMVTVPFDPARYLKTDADRIAYLRACAEAGLLLDAWSCVERSFQQPAIPPGAAAIPHPSELDE